MAIREDTPGYIAQAFPKLFPHGTSDFHDPRGGRTAVGSPNRMLNFAAWGRYVMTWHDGRFMRHSRFRYWLLDTSLRTMTPSMQRVFFKTHSASADYTLQDLQDAKKAKELVQQMSTSTSKLPGSVGERRQMRQKLEGMVNQVEAETADNGENGGAGRIPAGFCTLTCPVYKWEQLFEITLRSYPSGSADDPNAREYYESWKSLPPGPARNTAMRKAFYQLSVANPGCVEWYCALKLELAVHLIQDVLTQQLRSVLTPGLKDVKDRIRDALKDKLGLDIDVDELHIPDLAHFGHVDDFWLSFEWSAGGIVHAHIALWIVGSPRIDKIVVPKEKEDNVVEVDVTEEDATVLVHEEAAAQMAAFWDRVLTEFNVSKALKGHDATALKGHDDAPALLGTEEGTAAAQRDDPLRGLYDLCEQIGRRQQIGKTVERQTPSPECLSYETLMHCLIESGDCVPEAAEACWLELDTILAECGGIDDLSGRHRGAEVDGAPGDLRPGSTSREERDSGAEVDGAMGDLRPGAASREKKKNKSARARKLFVAALAEWANMHDLHQPFALGPPSVEQSCATIENEHSTQQRVSCNKLYPRKILFPGQEEIAEDPRRRDLYRLWLARNCHFLNNFIPIVLLAMLSNMDFQATLTKDAVIEYMTKYLTKSGQGSLVKVMQQSFSLCIEKAREQQQGAGSAILRWFNVQTITEVKSQLETMHLLFGVPRWLCSREFKDIWLRSEMRKVKSPEEIAQAESKGESVGSKSEADAYGQRAEWKLPTQEELQHKHALTKRPFWKEILRTVGEPVSDSARLPARLPDVEAAWPLFTQLMSWWQFKRYFNRTRAGSSIKCRPYPDIVIVHPEGRFTTAMTPEQWREATILVLMAYCNHGPCCADTTFRGLKDLEALSPDDLEALMLAFATAKPEERLGRKMTSCPPHLRRNYLLGDARRRRAEERLLSRPRVAASLPKVKYVFEEDGPIWRHKPTAEMGDDLALAKKAWCTAEDDEKADLDERAKLCQSDEDLKIRERMKECLNRLKIKHSELHDATLLAGLAVPQRPSTLNYFTALHTEFGDTKAGFLPQNFKSHTKAKIYDVLRCLFRAGTKKDTKPALVGQLATKLNNVLEVCRKVHGSSEDEGSDQISCVGDDDETSCKGRARKRRSLVRYPEQLGEVPHDAVVTAEQAESALGRNLATEWDEDLLEQLDMDQREEEEELAGRLIHPDGVDYSCLAWSPASSLTAPDSVNAKDMGWHPPLLLPELTRKDFQCDRESVRATLERGIHDLEARCAAELDKKDAEADLQREAGALDPTQRLAFDVVSEWAQKRLEWRQRKRSQSVTAPPPLRLLLLGTAGTGKTHTAKLSIRKVRRVLGRFHSVLTLAFSGVAAANLGGGARTIDSIFHTNVDEALYDLVGEQLDRLVEELRHVELLLIDEISTVGAAQLEIVNRRLQQVARVLHRERFGTEPPEDMGSFGGIGVVVMGDFAQLPPVLASSLLPGAAVLERPRSGKQALALSGRRTFQTFTDVIRLRRIHRQKGADAYKDSTMRLRDGAITLEDYELWQQHQILSINPTDAVPWEGGEGLLQNCLTLVADNRQAGGINGKRLAAAAPLAQAPGSVTATQTIVRCEARHSHPKGEFRKADEFRNVRKALHLRVGARVMLCLNNLWDVPVVPLGLMNGARGIVVAILYAPAGSARVDGNAMAGTGFPASDRRSVPKGLDNCPLPDFVVVHFPEYTGPAIFPHLPPTWIPIPTAEVRSDKSKSLLRVNLPLRLAWALTFHKSQGITAHEGTTISFAGTRMPAAASKPGLAFVGWTRATQWAKVAFHGLPPLEEFLAVRMQRDFQLRSAFEEHADALHDAFLLKRGISHQQHLAAHQAHLDRSFMETEGRHASAAELQDLEAMLGKRGVAPVSNSVKAWAERRTGCKSMMGLWAIVGSFRSSKKAKDVADEKGNATSRVRAFKAPTTEQVTTALLQEHGYPDDDIAKALAACGPSLERCIDYCLQLSVAPDALPQADEPIDEQDWARQVMMDLGFGELHVTKALEQCHFDFPLALTSLLYGEHQERKLSQPFKRHTSKLTVPAICVSTTERKAQYTARGRRDLRTQVRPLDLGQYAGDTTNACFWLCLAAGLTRSKWLPDSRQWLRLRSFDDARVSPIPTGDATIRDSHLGQFAKQLRHYMCLGDEAAMLQPRVRDKIYLAFATLGARGPRRTMQLYKQWVAKLASTEFADELVLLAVASELRVRIVCIPYTRPGQPDWSISPYTPAGHDVPEDRTVLLGNDDVHYMWLASDELCTAT